MIKNSHFSKRSTFIKTMARTGNHTTPQPTSTYANTNEMADLQNSLANLQFQGYRGRGGRLSHQSQHQLRSLEQRYNSLTELFITIPTFSLGTSFLTKSL